MKKIVLSTFTVLTLGSVVANATALKLYQDARGQVFTQPADGRVALKDSTPVYAKASKLKFSGDTFIGAISQDYTSVDKSTTAEMEIRRAYIQLKAYLLEDPKSYFRVTYDLHNEDGSQMVRAKYAYLYLDNIFINTGVEIGLAHRPWHDYEEHNSWLYRSIAKILTEDKYHGGDLSNSADLGVMTKTRTQYLDADLGVFNGEGYHANQNNANGLSGEWRVTAHILGTKGKPTNATYFDASFFGQYNVAHKTASDGVNEDLIFMGLHTVYNQPSFLVAAQYINSLDTRDGAKVSGQAGSGFSINGEYRLGEHKEYRILARYDSWTKELENSDDEEANTGIIVGAAWEQNKNVEWVANVTVTDNVNDEYDTTAYMLTAEVKF